MKVYVTKYALTGEIRVCTVQRESDDGNYVYVTYRPGPFKTQCVLGRDAFESESEALKNARVRIARRLKSLAKEKAKLEQLDATYATMLEIDNAKD